MIIQDENARKEIIAMLSKAYNMELETVQSYIANSINPDGIRAQEIKEALADDIDTELGHARKYANRINELGGTVPGSMSFKAEQLTLQPVNPATDIISVINGVIEAERGAITYHGIVYEACMAAKDYVTANMVLDIITDEQGHLREFESYLKEYE